METVLITGAAGFIGSHCAQRLAADGRRVVGLDNFCDFYDRAWKDANLAEVRGDFTNEEVDLADAAAVSRLIERVRPDAVLHLAARAGVRPSIDDPAAYLRVNVEGTANLLEAVRRTRPVPVVMASSSSVYGDGAVPFREDAVAAEPLSPYAASKRAAELVGHTYAHLHGVPVTCARLFTVYGPRQRPDLAIHRFARLIDAGEPVPVFGDGSTSRDYTYVDDIVAGLLAALGRDTSTGRFRVYNLGGGSPVTLAALVDAVAHATGRPVTIDRRPPQPGDVPHTHADIARARAELGWEPRVSLGEGLERFVHWLRRSP